MIHDWIGNLEYNLKDIHSHIAFSSTNLQNISLLLKYIQWPKHVIGSDPKKLRSFVSLSNKFPILWETVRWIICIAIVAIDLTPQVILYCLNTKNKQT